MESHKIIQVEEKVPLKLLLPLSIQHMFAMFGASELNADFYCSDKSKVTGIFGVELRISCTGRCCYQ